MKTFWFWVLVGALSASAGSIVGSLIEKSGGWRGLLAAWRRGQALRPATSSASGSSSTVHHVFHLDCPTYRASEGRGRLVRFVPVPDTSDTDRKVLSQITLRCEGCGTRVHVDVWPMQVVDPAAWQAKPDPGPCDATVKVDLFPDFPPVHCRLRAGHAGMHKSERGTIWNNAAVDKKGA